MTTYWITAEQRAEPRAARGRRLSSGFAEGDVLAGKYRIEAVLGEGGMGIVLRAMHVDLGCQVKGSGRNAWDRKSFEGRL